MGDAASFNYNAKVYGEGARQEIYESTHFRSG